MITSKWGGSFKFQNSVTITLKMDKSDETGAWLFKVTNFCEIKICSLSRSKILRLFSFLIEEKNLSSKKSNITAYTDGERMPTK